MAWPRLLMFMVVVFLLLTTVSSAIRKNQAFDLAESGHSSHAQPDGSKQDNTWCPVPERFTSIQDGLINSTDFSTDKALLKQQVDRLSAVVNVPTISYDDNGDVDEDPRWHAFLNLHKVLKVHFPRVHEKMNVEKVNKLGLLYTLQGSSKTLKPIVFMAHTDVVPVPDPTRWTHPPFEAFFDGRWLFGRGTADCKTDLVAIFSTMERLLEQDLKNNRTIILSFGFDETTGGVRGAKQLAAHLEERYGEKSMALIIVPGGGGMRTVGDVAYALPAVAEKGSLDIVLTLTTPGGHSAAPPPHTGIGIMSRLVTAVEDQAFTPHVYENNPILDYLKCEVEYSPKTAEPWLREALERGDDFADRIVESRGEPFRWLMQTSKSIDKMHGGIKDNQLPELTEAVINYGVLPSEKIEHVLKAAADLLVPIANQYNIAVNGPGYSQIDRGAGMLNISSANILQPSPITPTGQNIGVWNMLGGTIRQVFEHTRDEFSASKVIPVGILTLGNTDTAHYWRLSDNIYRFSPRWQGTSANVHTVDEKIDMQAHSGELQFYYELIRNMDGYTAE